MKRINGASAITFVVVFSIATCLLVFRFNFYMGFSINYVTVSEKVIKESEKFHDIIQENFTDSYKNLRYKSVMWLRWTSNYCSNAKYLLKLDDDIFVNVFKVIHYLEGRENMKNLLGNGEVSLAKQNKIFCYKWVGMPVLRDPKSKWYVPKDAYKSDTFPSYCSGWGYILTQNLVQAMYMTSFEKLFPWVEDFYVTGVLLQDLNVTYVHMADDFDFGLPPATTKLSDRLTFQWIERSVASFYKLSETLAKMPGEILVNGHVTETELEEFEEKVAKGKLENGFVNVAIEDEKEDSNSKISEDETVKSKSSTDDFDNFDINTYSTKKTAAERRVPVQRTKTTGF